MDFLSVALIAPGLAGLPPQPATSVEIYLYDLWKRLHHRVDTRLYGRQTALESFAGAERRRAIPGAVGASYIGRVLDDVAQASPGTARLIVQVDNRPSFVRAVRRRLADAPVVLGLHSMTFVQHSRISAKDASGAMRAAAAVVVNSDYVADRLRQRFTTGLDAMTVIRPGVDTERFHPCVTPTDRLARAALRRRMGAGGRMVILFVGRIIPRKGLHVLLAAARELRQGGIPVEVWVVGARPANDTAYGRTLARAAANVPVRWLGYVSHQRLPGIYRAADVFACPSQMPEAFGLVNLEAQACGLPLVASGEWGIPESVGDPATGLLVRRYRDPAAFALGLRELLRDGAQRKSIGRAARTRVVRECSFERTADRYMRLYRSIGQDSGSD